MSKSSHQIEVKAVDKTGGAFSSIKNRAAATGAQIRTMMGGALAAAGAYLGFSAIKGGIDELGHLSDIAQKTSTSVDELTQATAAMGALGIQNMGVEQLAKSFDYMAKTTGRSGMAGFYQTIGELGKIEDVALRGQEAMRIFGRSGMEFMPLINAADETVEALQTVVAAMPAIPQSAANAGDAVSDAMGFASNQVKSIWLQGLGLVCGWFDNQFAGGVREASLRAGNYLEYYTKVAVSKCISWFKKYWNAYAAIGGAAGTFVGAAWEKMFGTGGSWSDVFKLTAQSWEQEIDELGDKLQEIERIEEERTKRFERAFEDRAAAIEKFQGAYDKAAISIRQREKRDAAVADMSLKSPQVRNDLIMAGSNASSRVAMLGPQLQSESKKQTKLLETIANNTKSTADNTEKSAENSEGVEVLNV